MSTQDMLPFPIGSTYFTGGTVSSTGGVELEGREFDVLDLDYSTAPAKPRAISNGTEIKRVRVVRNNCPTGAGTSTAVLPGMLCSFKSGSYGKQIDGYVTTDAAEGYPADEFLPAAGAVQNDLFYIVVSGPAGVMAPVDATNANWSANSILVALTAATSGATTSGRVAPQTLNTTSTTLGNMVQNRVGVALSACTTGQTNSIRLAFINYRL